MNGAERSGCGDVVGGVCRGDGMEGGRIRGGGGECGEARAKRSEAQTEGVEGEGVFGGVERLYRLQRYGGAGRSR